MNDFMDTEIFERSATACAFLHNFEKRVIKALAVALVGHIMSI